MPHNSWRKRPLATVSGEPTVVVTDLGQQGEQLLALEEFHDQVDGAVASVNDELVNPHHVLMLELGHVLELGLEVHDHFVVAGLDQFHSELAPGAQLPTPLHETDGPLAQRLQLLEAVGEAVEAVAGAGLRQDLDLFVLGHEQEDVSLGTDARAREVW